MNADQQPQSRQEPPPQALVPVSPWAMPMAFEPPNRFTQAAQVHTLLHRCAMALRHRWWILFLCLLFVGGPALVYAWLKAPTFQSQAILWMTSKLNLPEGKMFSDELISYMGTQADLIKSAVVQIRAYDRVRARFPEIAAAATNAVIASVDDLPFKLTVRTSMKSSVLELRATGRSPEATRAFLDAVMDEYLSLKKDSRKQTSFGALAAITDQVREAEKQIQTLQQQMTAYETTNNLSYITENNQNAGKRLADLGALLSDLRTESQVLQMLTPDQLKEMADRPRYSDSTRLPPGEATAQNFARASAGSQQGYYAALEQYQLLKARHDDFAQYLRPNHSKMIKLNQDIAGLEKLMEILKQQDQQLAKGQIASRKQSIDVQVQNLEAQYRAWETNAIDASRKLAEFDRMKDDIKRRQDLYDKLLGLFQTVDLTKGLDQEPLAQLAPASTPQPTSAKLKIAAAGLFLALMLGASLLLLVEVMDERFTSVDDLSALIPEDVLGQIPESRLNGRNGKPRRLKHPDDQHAFAESFRNLRSSLLFMFEQASRPKVILVTSAVPKEGKTTVAANFASALVMAGARVLLVDADLRCSSLHKTFGVSLAPGLREVLAGEVPLAQAIVPVGLGTTDHGPRTTDNGPGTRDQGPRDQGTAGNGPGTKGPRTSSPDGGLRAVDSWLATRFSLQPSAFSLFLLPAGEAAASSSEIFLRCHLEELLQELRSQFDYVVIDSAPVLATDDAASLGPKADGVFMVVRASYTSSRMAREALDRLKKRHAKVLGVIYNRAPASSDYYYRYSGHYRLNADH